MNRARTILRVTLLLVFVSLGAVSFWESWARLATAARRALAPHPGPWPWAVDGFIVAMVLLVFLALMEQRRPTLARVGVLALTAFSAALATLYTPDHAEGRWHAAYFVSAWPPVGAWLSFEGIMWLLFSGKSATHVTSLDAQREVHVAARTDLHAADDAPPVDLDPPGTPAWKQRAIERAARFTSAEQRRIRTLAADGHKATSIAKTMHVDAGAVRVVLDQLKVEGNGAEVRP